MNFLRRFKIGVFGSGGGSEVKTLMSRAREVGTVIALCNGVLVTGGCGGLPHEAALGAAENGGLVIGISPAMNLREHVEEYCFPADPFYNLIFTGMEKKGRNILNLRTCDAAVFIGGRTGSLNEFTIAYDEAEDGFAIGILSGTGGLVEPVYKMIRNGEKGSWAYVLVEYEPRRLVGMIFNHLTAYRYRP